MNDDVLGRERELSERPVVAVALRLPAWRWELAAKLLERVVHDALPMPARARGL